MRSPAVELEKKAPGTKTGIEEGVRRGFKKPSLSLPVRVRPQSDRDSRASSSTESAHLYSSSSGSMTTDSSASQIPRLLSREEQKRLLVDRLMHHFFKLLATNARPRAKGGSSSSKNNSPESSSSSPTETNSPIRTRGELLSGRRARDGRGKRAAEHDASEDSEEEDEGRRRRSKAKLAKIEEVETRRLGCPFFKRNPHRYKAERSCVGPGWLTVHRVK